MEKKRNLIYVSGSTLHMSGDFKTVVLKKGCFLCFFSHNGTISLNESILHPININMDTGPSEVRPIFFFKLKRKFFFMSLFIGGFE